MVHFKNKLILSGMLIYTAYMANRSLEKNYLFFLLLLFLLDNYHEGVLTVFYPFLLSLPDSYLYIIHGLYQICASILIQFQVTQSEKKFC